ncbi:signal transduction protein [Haladaptatus sp. W1]|uniref:CBS domain-containing protein n=1 Tax=unclassified Haladaptatus TaxID=2622732 RepID=UPI0008497B24|nr:MULTISPECIES: CBS domain-containing protein [unclassified Haladaptatus]ODR81947.1 signal transduction protein [Haladaptatus sp. W1]GKZ12471.1 inosine-5-monophosphate dehydrogenase [Haladaptatus sp. T7]
MDAEVIVRDVMTREYVGVSESDTVLGAVRLMSDEGVGSVVVLRGREPVGIMTEADVLSLVADEEDPKETTVSEAMSKPVISMRPDRSLADAAGMMAQQGIRRIIITGADDELLGVLTERDVISASASPPSITRSNERERERQAADTELGGRMETNGGDSEYTNQSICEVCGALTHDLTNVNGQLVCADCRDF